MQSPDDNDDKALAVLERSLPDPKRPRVSDRDEQRFGAADRRSAIAYATAELACERLDAATSDGIPDEDLIGDTTLVTLIGELRAVVRAGEEKEKEP
jgi:hypothetical protein